MSTSDILAENHGSIWLLSSGTDAGREWLEEHVAFEQHLGRRGVVEHRYVSPILEGADAAGLTVEVA